MVLGRLLAWIQSSHLATIVGDSTPITGLLSAIHLIGMTVIVGAAIVTNLRVAGLAFADRPIAEVARAARRNISIGLAVSVSTGLLLFSTRATAAAANDTFRLKMLLLSAATLLHFAFHRRLLERATTVARLVRWLALVSLLLWLSVACVCITYILLE
jgi:hypothetical protein